MAPIRWLGLQRPAALDYLVAEGILQKDPPREAFDWHISSDGNNIEEELVSTKHCVVWSQGGVIRRIFRFEVEGQEVKQALLTRFAVDDGRDRRKHIDELGRQAGQDANFPEGHEPDSHTTANSLGTAKPTDSWAEQVQPPQKPTPRALVVLLQHQAHIYYLRGSSQTVNLPFEVERAWALPTGLLLQRKLHVSAVIPPTPIPPSVPQNSLYSSQPIPWSSPHPQQGALAAGRARLSGVNPRTSTRLSQGPVSQAATDLPRLFVLNDPAAELGLVVEAAKRLSAEPSLSRLEPPSSDEEVLYASSSCEVGSSDSARRPLVLIVTVNRNLGVYTVWQASYTATGPPQPIERTSKKRVSTFKRATRRSSYNTRFSTGASTPTLRQQDTLKDPPHEGAGRRSFAGTRASASRLSESFLFDQEDDAIFNTNDHGERTGRGPSLRTTRRTSSMLARTELSSQDAFPFADIARNPAGANTSFATAGLRGHSFGVVQDRMSFGRSRMSGRASTPGSTSMLSDVEEGSQIEEAIDESFVAGCFDSGPSDIFDPSGGLRRGMVMIRAFQIPLQNSSHANGLPQPSPSTRIIVQGPTSLPRSSEDTRHMSLYLSQRDTAQLYEVTLSVRCLRRQNALKAKRRSRDRSSQDLIMLQHTHSVRVRHQNVRDVIKVCDDSSSRILFLCQEQNTTKLFLLSSCSELDNLTFPLHLNPEVIEVPFPSASDSRNANFMTNFTTNNRENPVASGLTGKPGSLDHVGSHGRFDLVSPEGRYHRCQLQLRSRHPEVLHVLQTCKAALSESGTYDLEHVWWLISQQIFAGQSCHDWTALIVLLMRLIMSLANPQTSFTRNAATEHAHTTVEAKLRDDSWSPAWDWAIADSRVSDILSSESNTPPLHQPPLFKIADRYLLDCAQVAQDGLKRTEQDPHVHDGMVVDDSEHANQEKQHAALKRLLLSLYILQMEESQLRSAMNSNHRLAPLLAQCARWLALLDSEDYFTKRSPQGILLDDCECFQEISASHGSLRLV